MNRWLLKTEPGEYSWVDLVRERKAEWTGVTNPTAVKNIRSMKSGDAAMIYHTGDERAVVGLAKIVSAPREVLAGGRKSAVVDVAPVRKLARPVTLAEIKADRAFAEWELVRVGRLSVMPVTAAIWERIEKMAKTAVKK